MLSYFHTVFSIAKYGKATSGWTRWTPKKDKIPIYTSLFRKCSKIGIYRGLGSPANDLADLLAGEISSSSKKRQNSRVQLKGMASTTSFPTEGERALQPSPYAPYRQSNALGIHCGHSKWQKRDSCAACSYRSKGLLFAARGVSDRASREKGSLHQPVFLVSTFLNFRAILPCQNRVDEYRFLNFDSCESDWL